MWSILCGTTWVALIKVSEYEAGDQRIPVYVQGETSDLAESLKFGDKQSAEDYIGAHLSQRPKMNSSDINFVPMEIGVEEGRFGKLYRLL